MIETFTGLAKFIRKRTLYIDERVFRMHSIFTSMILLFCFILMTTKQLAGDPIDCDTNRNSVKGSVLNTYCLIHYTYTMRKSFFKRQGIDVVAPGIRYGPKEDEIHYSYYQWIWFLFFVEAILFYIPYWLWKGCESGTIKHLISGYKEFLSEQAKTKKKQFIVNFLLNHVDHNESYGRKYVLCMSLALINVLVQIIVINFLFNGEFYAYGLKIFSFLNEDPENRRDALIKVFPRVTSCRFNKFGTSGSIQELDALCVLPLNMYNEILFVFFWFWFLFLAIILFLSITHKILLMISSFLRFYYVRTEFRLSDDMSRDRLNKKYVDPKKIHFGETLLLILIKQNTGLMFCREVLLDLNEKRRQMKEDCELGHIGHTSNTCHTFTKAIQENHVNNRNRGSGSLNRPTETSQLISVEGSDNIHTTHTTHTIPEMEENKIGSDIRNDSE